MLDHSKRGCCVTGALALAVAAGFFAAISAGAAEEEKSLGQLLTEQYVYCVAAAARELDDRVSDATTIATAADVTCSAQKRMMARELVLEIGENPDTVAGDTLVNNLMAKRDVATRVVLQVRAMDASAE